MAIFNRIVKRVPMVSHGRDYLLRSGLGYTVNYPKGEAVPTPVDIMDEAMAVGIVLADESDAPKPPAEDEAPPTGKLREDMILDAMRDMVMKNERGTFSAGKPSVKVLIERLGWDIDARERNALWTKLQAELAAGDA